MVSRKTLIKCMALFLATVLVLIPLNANAQGIEPPRPTNWPKPMDHFGLLTPVEGQSEVMEDLNPSNLNLDSLPPLVNDSDWSRIVYQSYVNGNWDILLTDPNKSFTTLITPETSADVTPRLNRGGTRFVYASNIFGDFEILSRDLNSGAAINLTNNSGDDYTPEWSPDGSKIVFVGMSSATNPDIYTVNANGTSITRLTYGAITEEDYFPAWSPDGSKIMWVKSDANGLGAIWMMNSDGTNQVAFSSQIWYMQHPVWSKDGTKIAFDADLDGDGWNEIGTINSDGTNFQIRLDLNTNFIEPWVGAWSPDGKSVLYTEIRYGQSGGSLYIYQATLHNSYANNYHYAFTTTGYEMNPDWKVIDLQAPLTSIVPLPAQSPAADFYATCQGYDQGLSGIASYDFQYKILPGVTWTSMDRVQVPGIKFAATPNTTVCFRCRAIDWAFNLESWAEGGAEEACTSFHTWDISGKITDNRGAPLKSVTVNINPGSITKILTDDQGKFSVKLYSEGTQMVSVSTGISEPYSATIEDVDSSMNLNLYTAPASSILQNGGFEIGTPQPTGWTISGTLETKVTTSVVHTGSKSIEIGSSCPSNACISAPEEIGTGSQPSIVIDPSRAVHLIYKDTINGVTSIYYRTRSVNGVWSEPAFVFSVSTTGAYTELIIDKDQTLHIAASDPYSLSVPYLYYAQKKLGGGWSQPELVSGKGVPHLVVDDNYKVHLLTWSDLGNVAYYVRSPQGSWSSSIVLYGGAPAKGDMVMSEDGVIHILYGDRMYSRLYQLSILPDGRMTPPIPFYSPTFNGGGNLTLSKDLENSVLFFNQDGNVSQGGGMYFGKRDQYGNVTVLERHLYDWATISPDQSGLVNQFSSLGSNLYYLSRTPEGIWSSPQTVLQNSTTNLPNGVATVDNFALPHFMMQKYSSSAGSSLSYFRLQESNVTQSGEINQQVAIPNDMPHPTLSFMYRTWRVTPETQSNLQVQIEEGSNITSLKTLGYSTDWNLAWLDLSAWAGKTITIKFVLNQQPIDPYVKYYLDDISLGAWTTPLIENVNPGALEIYDQDLITIHGENFIEPFTLYLGQYLITSFLVIDSQTIQFNLPPQIGPGIYDVRLTTPLGQETTLPSGLRLGYSVFLPGVMR